MPRTPAIQFPGYRRFDRARIEANDATMALLVGSRLATHLLAANAGSAIYLPDIYPAVSGIDRLHLRADTASSLLRDAEAHLSSMAIPYVWATYEVFIESSTEILVAAGKRRMTSAERRRGIMGRHDYIGSVTTLFMTDDVALLNLIRNIRNCIVHEGGKVSLGVSRAWSALSPSAGARWIDYAGRALHLTGELDLLSGEVIGCLAITKVMARQVSSLLNAAVSGSAWSRIIVDDFLRNHPYSSRVAKDPAVLRRKVRGWNRMYYSSAGVTEAELDADLRRRSL